MMPRPSTIPRPATEQGRRLKPDAVQPDVTFWNAADGSGRVLALLDYRGARSYAIADSEPQARHDCLQFYMEHTARGRADSD